MKITRETIIDGQSIKKEYPLTEEELTQAFIEYQRTHDMAEVKHQLKDLEYEDVPDDVVESLADQFRENMDDKMDENILAVIRNNEKELESYKIKWRVFYKTVSVKVEKDYTIKARDADEAEMLFEKWAEEHGRTLQNDLSDEIDDFSDYDYESVVEAHTDFNSVDIDGEE